VLTVQLASDAAGRLPRLRHLALGLLGGEERLPGRMPRGDRLGCCLVPGLQNVWVCAHDLQLIRADRIISLLVPIAAGYGAASPDDGSLPEAVCAEIEGGTDDDALTRMKLADCGRSPAGELLAGLASALGSASAADPAAGAGCMFIFAEHDPAGFSRWVTASQLPAAWPQSTSPGDTPAALTRSPLA
jgi:hypothetical protein